MEKLNYNDFNKFLVSLGVILIGLALLIPWLFLKESYNIPTKIEIDSLTDISKKIFEVKQGYLLIFSNLIPWISVFLIITGIFLAVSGLTRWYKKQLIIDKKDNLDIQKLEKEIQLMSPIEVVDKAQKETRDDSIAQLIETVELDVSKKEIMSQESHPWKKYIEIERAIADKIIDFNSDIFEILPNVKVGFSEMDILLKSRNQIYSDKIIEIKYYKSGIRKSFINMVASNLRTTIEIYRVKVKRNVIPVVIFVFREGTDDYKNKTEIIELVQNSGRELGLEDIQIEFVKEEEIIEFNVENILKPVKTAAHNTQYNQ
jgi:hypothetical protein